MTRDDSQFYRGMAVILGVLCRRDEPSLAYDAMCTNGVTIENLREAKVDRFDLKPIERMWKSEHRAAASDAAAPPRCADCGAEFTEAEDAPLSGHSTRPGQCRAPQPAAPTKTERCPWYEDGEHRNCHGAAHPSAKGGDTSNGKGG